MDKVEVCIIPAAGTGSRWLPISHYLPKEMLPLGNRPVIEYSVQEAIEAGCKDVVIVINRKKEIIKRHLFGGTGFGKRARLHFVYQNEPKGVAHALLQARRLIEGRNFAVIFPDHPSLYKIPPLRKLIQAFGQNHGEYHFIPFAEYPKNNMLFYGEFLTRPLRGRLLEVVHLCPRAKKPGESHHPGNELRGAGRYVWSHRIFPLVERSLDEGRGKEVGDAEIIELAIRTGQKILGLRMEELFLEMGTPETYALSNAKFFTTAIKQGHP